MQKLHEFLEKATNVATSGFRNINFFGVSRNVNVARQKCIHAVVFLFIYILIYLIFLYFLPCLANTQTAVPTASPKRLQPEKWRSTSASRPSTGGEWRVAGGTM